MSNNNDDTWTSDALEQGDVAAVRERAENEPGYLEQRDFVGDTPLLAAIGFGHAELVKFMLSKGADPNVEVNDGYTCLLTAVESDEPASDQILDTLIAAGADIHQAGTNGWTPLHMAAVHNQVAKAQRLLGAGARIDERKQIDAGETPLMEAAYGGHAEMVRLLLDNGADATLRDGIGNHTSLEMAQEQAKGPDPDVYQSLKEVQSETDVDELFADAGFTKEQVEILRQSMKTVDLAENYLQEAQQSVESGSYDEVIRMLSEHAQTS